jgi:hypothetical protein
MRRAPLRLAGPSARSDDERAAMFLAAAVAVGLLFAASLTMFGGPITQQIRGLAPEAAISATR